MDYNNIFLAKNIAELLKNIKINDYTIKLEEDNQQFFCLFYSLELVELKIFKTYIKINIDNNFINPFKSPAKTFILFNWKQDGNLRFNVNY